MNIFNSFIWDLIFFNSCNQQTLRFNPLNYSDILKQFHCCQYFLRHSVSIQKASKNLKCVTLRFVNKIDMTETFLRSIINSGIWRSVMTPIYSTMNLVIVWTINVVTNSLCLTIFYCSEIRSSVSTIPCSISLPTSTLLLVLWYDILVT